MTTSVTVIDYGIGNLLNMVRALEHCGASVRVVAKASPEDLQADRLVLPGVGAFGDGMVELRARGFDELALRFVATGRPFLGVCVGMQMLFDASEEMGEHAGLGLLAGRVVAVPPTGVDGRPHHVPHIGWRRMQPVAPWAGTIFQDLAPGTRGYFVHSYAGQPQDPAVRLAEVDYDGRILCAAVHRDNIYGCQFHPERSAAAGLGILRRFLAL